MGFFDFVGDIISPVTDIIGGVLGNESAEDASDAARDAANAQVNSQLEALNYLKEIEKIPQQFRQEALKKVGGLYGLEGGEGSQQQLINRAMKSPLYSAIMSGQNEGEAGILRNASATGGLRSGNVQGALYDYNVDLKTKALLDSYNNELSGLQGLASLPSNANQIAAATTGIGKTQAQGITASSQIEQEGNENFLSSILPSSASILGGLSRIFI